MRQTLELGFKAHARQLAKFSLKKPTKSLQQHEKQSIQPTHPVRTRFAPSPTGSLHLGSLRTALYNFLLAKSTGGTFLLRLEDTDQKRLVPKAESSLYETLEWLGLLWDEGPKVGGPYGPYRQSERSQIYQRYAQHLLAEGKAYRCFCTKERLDGLAQSAKVLKPPTNVSYDRKCDKSPEKKSEYTIRFRSPETYPPFEDLLHGKVRMQSQINPVDVRYDDPVLIKSDGLPTYHFANVVDDHLMKITHVVRGEEWLPSTPKHLALYAALGWEPPKFVHIPLLTSLEDKKLSKRSGDLDIWTLKQRGYLKEALLNFAVLFGWAPKRDTPGHTVKEVFTLEMLEKLFSLDGLTKGNAKVDFRKLDFLNKSHLGIKLNSDPEFFSLCVDECSAHLTRVSKAYISDCLKAVGPSLTTINELWGDEYSYLFEEPNLSTENGTEFLSRFPQALDILNYSASLEKLTADRVQANTSFESKAVFQTLRFALSGASHGLKLPLLIELLGEKTVSKRIHNAMKFLQCT